MASFDVRRLLVVGPRLIAERVWNIECAEWEHLRHLRVVRMVGTRDQRLSALAKEADIYTLTRDNAAWLRDQYIHRVEVSKNKWKWVQYKHFPFDTLLLDESQSYKDQGSDRSLAVRQLRQLVERVYLATGSLMPNGYEDVWHQAYLIDGGAALEASESKFHDKYFHKVMHDGYPTYTLKEGADKEIDAKLAMLFHVLRDAQPPVPRNFIRVGLSKSERAAYSRMVRQSVLDIGGQQITAVNAGVLWGKLLQMANGAVYDEKKNWHEIHKAKLEALWELLESLPRPVIVGYGFVHDVERIFNGCPKSAGRMAILRTGASLDAWRRGEIDIGVMHPASAGHGLNDLYVSGGENIVWFGLTPRREFYDQLNGRLAGGHRRAGKQICIHHLLTEGTIDEEALAILDLKGEQQLQAQIRVAQRLVKGEIWPGERSSTDNPSSSPTAQTKPSIKSSANDAKPIGTTLWD